nr:hypothetical protein [Tanacetum cinerariifolium]
MVGNLKLLSNFVEQFLGTMKFGNDKIAPILGYGYLGNDLLIGSRDIDFYSITLQDTSTPNLICLMAKATSSQAWLWHHRLSHLNFDTINLLLKYDIVTGLPKFKFIKDHLCSSCELEKAKHTPSLIIQTTTETTSQAPTVTANKNIIQAKTNKEYAQVEEDEFINIFSTLLETSDEMCMFALIVSQTEPKNIKESMANSAWIEAMREVLHSLID